MGVRGVFLLFATAVGQSITKDSITPTEIINQNGGLVIKQCPGQEGTLQIAQIKFNRSTMAVQVNGTLTNELTDGHIVARITPGEAPKNANRWQRMKRRMALSWKQAYSGKANQTVPFCSEQRHCPITKGAQKLNFAFTRLPRLILAGGYHLQLNAYDQTGGLVVCMEGALTVNHGRHGEVIRTLETCEDMAWDDNWDGDKMCNHFVVEHGKCDDPGLRDHVMHYCRKACGKCQGRRMATINGRRAEEHANMPEEQNTPTAADNATMDCRNHPWEQRRSAEEQCHSLREHGYCDSNDAGTMAHMNMHCRRTCGKCHQSTGGGNEGHSQGVTEGHAEADDAQGNRVLLVLVGFLVVTLCSVF